MNRLLYTQFRRKAFLARWSKLDWSKSNCELGDEVGLSSERLRQIRQQVGAPKPTYRYHWLRQTAKALQWAEENLDQLKGLSGTELGRKYGLSPRWQQGLLYQFLKPFLRDGRLIRKHRWDLMDFRLPNRDLERIWRLPRNVAGSRRYRKRLPRPTWDLRQGRGYAHWSERGQLEAYRRAVKAEERKASRYFAQG
ncbi:MAG: hypothetical protein ABSD29_08650 [Verrucomicrobiota bacterium]|jgi:hypothetical protein